MKRLEIFLDTMLYKAMYEAKEIQFFLGLHEETGVILEAEIVSPTKERMFIDPKIATILLGGPSLEIRQFLLKKAEEQQFFEGSTS